MNIRRRRALYVARRSLCAAALACAAAGASAQTVSALDVSRALASNSVISSPHAFAVDANEAARRLEQAQRRREQGASPRPGEQALSTEPGQVNHRYWRRQEKLRHLVEQALHRSNETHRSSAAPTRKTRRARRHPF
ncbi:MAG: hypothetical protein WCA01_16065 [Burkholderiales bacterium]